MKKEIKEKLKGTCVLNEKEGMGAEIVKLYTEAGFENTKCYSGGNIGWYYGVNVTDGFVCEFSRKSFSKRLTLDQLRAIVRGEYKEESEQDKIEQKVKRVITEYKLWNGIKDCDYNYGHLFNALRSLYLEGEHDYIEQVELKQSSPEIQDQFVKANPDMKHSVEFKEGEMVDVKMNDWLDFNHESEEYITTLEREGRIKHVTFDSHYFHLRDEIRKIDPDKELKDLAKEIFKKHYELKTAANKCDEFILSHMEYAINAMVEAMKRVKK